MPKSNLAKPLSSRRIDYIRGMMAGGRAQSGKSTSDIAAKFGVTNRTIAKWFETPEIMQLKDFYQICDVLGLKISIEFKDVPE